MLLMIVATTVACLSVPRPSISAATIAKTSSPSTTVPVSSTKIARSASPSRAIPSCALCGAHGLLQTFGVHGAAPAVDVGSIRAGAHDHHAGSQLAQQLRTDPIRRAVGTVDDDLEPGQGAMLRKAGLEELLVSRGGILDRERPVRCRPPVGCASAALPLRTSRSISSSTSSGSLKPLGAKNLMPLS